MIKNAQKSGWITILSIFCVIMILFSQKTATGQVDGLGIVFSSEQSLDNNELQLDTIQNEFLVKFSSFLGGTDWDQSYAIDVDLEDNIILAGNTGSDDFLLENAFNYTLGGTADAFITKITPSHEIVFSTFLGGDGSEFTWETEADSSGNIIVVGHTTSTNFPIKNEIQGTYGGGTSDAFVSKFSPTGELMFSTYLGGDGQEWPYGMTLDSQDNIIVTGFTYSTDFPTLNGFDNALDGTNDAFLTKISPNGELIFSTYLGGEGNDAGIAVTVNSNDEIIFGGRTNSLTIPVQNGYNDTLGLDYDAYIALLHPNGAIIWSSYYGGNGYDDIATLAVDSMDNIIWGGNTYSPNLPMLNAYNSTYGAGHDVHLAKMAYNGTLMWSTYDGGSAHDNPYRVLVNPSDEIFLVGRTGSDTLFTKNPIQSQNGGGWDMFFQKYSNSGTPTWGTYLGGQYLDEALDASLDSHGDLVVGGRTDNSDFYTKDPIDNIKFNQEATVLVVYDPDGDWDDDGLTNFEEGQLGTQIENPDSDGDGVPDGIEVTLGLDPTAPADGDTDTDDDGIPDYYEVEHGLDPNDGTDAAGDLDNDTMPNLCEYTYGFDINDPSDAWQDPDEDLLFNTQECLIGTDPFDPDTDNDYIMDGLEVQVYFTDPLNPDTDGDGVSDGHEILVDYSNPLKQGSSGGGSNGGFLSIPMFSVLSGIMIILAFYKSRNRFRQY